MNRLAIILLLAAFSGSAAAEWVEVRGKGEGVTLYTDPATIRKAGNRVKMWSLLDYKTNQFDAGHQFMSGREQIEYDCKEEQVRTLHFSIHSENMARGKTVFPTPTLASGCQSRLSP